MLLIKNGFVIDPLNHLEQKADILVKDGLISAVAPQIPDIPYNTVDATGCYVTPGLIDHHAHIWPLAQIGIPAESACFSAGVTTVVDAGSTGSAAYAAYRPYIQIEKVKIRAYLNVCTTGLATLPVPEDVSPDHINEEAILECFEHFKDELEGLKIRTSRFIVGNLGYEPVKTAIRIADRLGVPIMVHCTDPPGELSDLIDMLRPGDVLTHMYMNKGSCLVKNGKVIEAAWRGRERGVLFEAADAREHFGMDVAQEAIAEGFLPDIIATDLTKLSMHLRPTSFNMAMQISKYTALGVPLPAVIQMCTVNPARQMKMLDSIGSLTPGHAADIAVFREVKKNNTFGDRPYGKPEQQLITGYTIYQPVLTVKDGEMVYRDVTF